MKHEAIATSPNSGINAFTGEGTKVSTSFSAAVFMFLNFSSELNDVTN